MFERCDPKTKVNNNAEITITTKLMKAASVFVKRVLNRRPRGYPDLPGTCLFHLGSHPQEGQMTRLGRGLHGLGFAITALNCK